MGSMIIWTLVIIYLQKVLYESLLRVFDRHAKFGRRRNVDRNYSYLFGHNFSICFDCIGCRCWYHYKKTKSSKLEIARTGKEQTTYGLQVYQRSFLSSKQRNLFIFISTLQQKNSQIL